MSEYVYEWREDSNRFCVVSGADSNEAVGLSPYDGAAYCRSLARPLQLRPLYDDRGELPLADFAYHSCQPKVLSERAWTALSSELASFGTAFPASVVGADQPYWVWFPSVVSDCLIEEETEFLETLSSYRKPTKPVLRAQAVPTSGPFTLAGFEKLQVWVRKSSVDTVTTSRLTGAVFNRRAKVVSSGCS